MDSSISEFEQNRFFANRIVCLNKKTNSKEYRSWWDGSLQTISYDSTLFAQVSVLDCRAEKIKYIAFCANILNSYFSGTLIMQKMRRRARPNMIQSLYVLKL